MGTLPDLSGTRIFDLAQPYFVGMPHHPSHPPFLFSLTKLHGDFTHPSGMSSAADSISMSGHTGTHLDALNHFSCNGRFFNGHSVVDAQTFSGGVTAHSVSTVAPILRRAVLLDVAGLLNVAALDEDFTITPEHLDAALASSSVAIDQGDVVLIRTGWAKFWRDSRRYISEVRGPGPAIEGAQWLSNKGIFAAGSDTVAFEKVPDAGMPVHVHMLVENGIHLIENLNLEELAAHRITEFLFIAAPLKIEGGTGAPTRPIALVS